MDNFNIDGKVLNTFELVMSKTEFKQLYSNLTTKDYKFHKLYDMILNNGDNHIEFMLDGLRIFNDDGELDISKIGKGELIPDDNEGNVKLTLECSIIGNSYDGKADMDIPNKDNIYFVLRDCDLVHHVNSSNGKVLILPKYDHPQYDDYRLTIKIDNNKFYEKIEDIDINRI